MSVFRVLICTFMLMVFFSELAIAEIDVRKSVVKIYTVQTQADYAKPWDKYSPELFRGSGCIINGNRILTNAHVVTLKIKLNCQV